MSHASGFKVLFVSYIFLSRTEINPKSVAKEEGMAYLLVFIFQLLFNVAKVYEIKYSYENKLKPILVAGASLSLLTLMSTYFSLELLLRGDWLVIVVFIGGSLTGKYIAYLMNRKGYRNRIYKFLKGGKE